MYDARGALSRARSTICFAAAAIPADVFAFVGALAPGGIGRGGGARSGSELSHLCYMLVSKCVVPYYGAFIRASPNGAVYLLNNQGGLTLAHSIAHSRTRNGNA